MSARTFVKPETGKSSTVTQRFGKKLRRKSFAPKSAENSVAKSQPRFGHNFGNVSVFPMQAKLAIGKPGDRYEQEADRTADRVMSMPEPKIQRQEEDKEEEKLQQKPISEQITPLVQREEDEEDTGQAKPISRQIIPLVQRQEDEEEKEEEGETASAKALSGQTPRVTRSVEAGVKSMKGGGSPLPESTRKFMEPRFGHDFGKVRVHTDSTASKTTGAIKARAFTVGNNIAFNSGQYSPDTTQGGTLLAHELTHVVQQRGPVRSKKFSVTSATPRIQRGLFGKIGDFFSEKLEAGKKWVKEKAKAAWNWLKKKLKAAVKFVPGYDLLMIVLGRTPATPANLVKGLLGLIPIWGKVLYARLNESGALTRAFEWLQSRLKKLRPKGGFSALFSRAWRQIELSKGYDYNKNIIFRVFGGLYTKIKMFIKAVGSKIKEFILKGALKLVGAPVKTVMGIINKGRATIMRILNDPIGFAKNLIKAIKGGFNLFKSNFVMHLKKGITDWLFGAMEGTGITLPEKFDLKGVFSLAMQLLGLTYERIRGKVVKRLGPKGETIISSVENSVTLLKDLATKGPIALWEKVQKSLGNLKDMVFDAIIGWVRKSIIVTAITKLVSLFIPGAGLVQAVMGMYQAVMFFIERIKQIGQIVMSIFNSISMIAMGKVGKASAWIEKVLGKSLSLIIGFLAKWLKLGAVGKRIKSVIEKMREKIDKPVDKVINWVVVKAKGLFGKGKALVKKGVEKGKKVVAKVLEWWKYKKKFIQGKESHTLLVKGEGKSAKLYVASNSLIFEEYMKTLKNQLNNNDYNKIQTQVNTINKLKQKKMTKTRGKQIRDELDKLVTLLKSVKTIEHRPPSIIDYKSVNKLNDIVGKKVVAKPLSINPGGHSGSIPTQKSKLWKAVKGRRFDRKRVYIRGHLLNHHLYGIGANNNLTPITYSLNTKMEKEVERKVKDKVLKENQVVHYEIEAVYGARGIRKAYPAEKELATKFKFKAEIMKKKKGTKGDKKEHWEGSNKKIDDVPTEIKHELPQYER